MGSRGQRDSRVAAIALAAALVGWSMTAGLEIPGRRHPVVQAGLGTALGLIARSSWGLRGTRLRAGARWGAANAVVVAAAVAATTAIPAVHLGMTSRPLPRSRWKWLAWEIPLGTVWSEEAAYRAALGSLAEAGFGQRRGALLQAAAFGLSHVFDARRTGEPVLGTVLVTGGAGWALGWLARRSGSILAPVLVHLAINEAGAVAAALVQRRGDRGH